MASPGGIFVWYPCNSAPMRAGTDERLSAWVFGGQSVILKLGYDLAWVSAGGTVGDSEYDNGIEFLLSDIIPNPLDPSGLTEAITTPTSVLIAFAGDWLAFTNEPTPCRVNPFT